MSKNSMHNYSQFALSDAVSLASWLDTEFDLKAVRRAFDGMSQSEGWQGRHRGHKGPAARFWDHGVGARSQLDRDSGLVGFDGAGCRLPRHQRKFFTVCAIKLKGHYSAYFPMSGRMMFAEYSGDFGYLDDDDDENGAE
ncbi:hypothetical protein ACTO5A_23495 [Pseudomonas aeruginosa]|nr:hypothetical protein [Pseudomonas aeruginosa]